MKQTRNYNDSKKRLLLKVIGELIKEKRIAKNKGILLLSYEFDISNSSIAQLEKGQRDVQITTLWKLANAFGYKCSDFIKLIEDELPEDFNFYN